MQHEAAKEQSFRMRFILSEFDSFFYLQKRKTGTWTSSLFFRAIIVVGGKREKKEIHTHHLQIKEALSFGSYTHTALSLLPGSRRVVFIHSENQLYIRRGEDNSRRGRRRSAAEEKDFALTTRFCRRNDDDGRLVSLERKNDDDVDKHRIRDASRG